MRLKLMHLSTRFSEFFYFQIKLRIKMFQIIIFSLRFKLGGESLQS